jgi:fumarate reductase subunit D
MSKNKDILVSGASTILHSIIIPVFALVFTIAYKPFGTYELLQIGQTSFSFNATICFCIIAISIILTRPWLYILGRYKKIVRPV